MSYALFVRERTFGVEMNDMSMTPYFDRYDAGADLISSRFFILI